eukprot:2287794-Rhodomonas_salina.2
MEAQGDREAAAIELGAVATGAAMGRYLTTVRSAHWLAPPGLQMKGRPLHFGSSMRSLRLAASAPSAPSPRLAWFPGVSTIQLPVDLLPADLRDRVQADLAAAGGGGRGARRGGGGGSGGGGGGGSAKAATQRAAWARPAPPRR